MPASGPNEPPEWQQFESHDRAMIEKIVTDRVKDAGWEEPHHVGEIYDSILDDPPGSDARARLLLRRRHLLAAGVVGRVGTGIPPAEDRTGHGDPDPAAERDRRADGEPNGGDRRPQGDRRPGRGAASSRPAPEGPVALRPVRRDLPGVRDGEGPDARSDAGAAEPVDPRPDAGRRQGRTSSRARRARGRTSSTSATGCSSPTSRTRTGCRERTGDRGARAPMLQRVFAEMFNVKTIAEILVRLPLRTTRGDTARRARRSRCRTRRRCRPTTPTAGGSTATCSRPRELSAALRRTRSAGSGAGLPARAASSSTRARSPGSTSSSAGRRRAEARPRMTITALRILPPLAIGRLGSRGRAARQLHRSRSTPSIPLDFRQIVPAETLRGGRADRRDREELRADAASSSRAAAKIRPVAPFLEVCAETSAGTLEPLTPTMLAERGLQAGETSPGGHRREPEGGSAGRATRTTTSSQAKVRFSDHTVAPARGPLQELRPPKRLHPPRRRPLHQAHDRVPARSGCGSRPRRG